MKPPAGDRLIWRIAAFSIAIAVVTLIVTQLTPSPFPKLIPGTLPRMQPPPANTTQLIRSLGVGSLVWYMCLASAPVFFWMARRFPLERGRLRAIAFALGAVVTLDGATALV